MLTHIGKKRVFSAFYEGIFWDFFLLLYPLFNTASSAAPSDSTVSEDDGFEPRTVAALALPAMQTL